MVEAAESYPKNWMELSDEEKGEYLQKLSDMYKGNGLETAKIKILE